MRKPQAAPLVLGIDTGGTYTDAVLLDYESRRVLATHKTLTTKRDLSIGIGRVIESICLEDPAAVRMVSVSTTLATNAVAEGRSRRVALFLVGYDPELIATFKMGERLVTPDYFFFSGGHDLYGREKAPLDLAGILDKVSELAGRIDAIAVSSYFSPLNPEHENRAFRAISSVSELPIVLGHQLSARLGSVERATTAALNATLLAVLRDFIVAVRRAMDDRQIDAPLMVVRGDGTLMSDEFAARTPVETIHSGPAASAMGGRFLSGLDDGLVIDVGGTTTDLALIEGGQVAVSEEGATVGGYKTSVKAATLLSIALGGDSHITLSPQRRITIGPERVTPLAHLAYSHPGVTERLRTLVLRSLGQASPNWLEFWFLNREPPGALVRSAQDQALVDCLRDGPLPVPEIVRRLGLLHAAQIGESELLRQEIVGKAGLTPTDLMHISGGYCVWDGRASALAWTVLCEQRQQDEHELAEHVWSRMSEMIVHAILTFLTGKRVHEAGSGGAAGHQDSEGLGLWFFENSIHSRHPQLETRIRLRQPIIGIGAPASIFLPKVAELLHTDLILPEHYPVANALGAVAGSVMVAEELRIYPRLSASGLEVAGYYVQSSDERTEFEGLDDALVHARALSRERALGAALRSGADDPQVIVEEVADGLDSYRVRAKAMGTPRLTR